MLCTYTSSQMLDSMRIIADRIKNWKKQLHEKMINKLQTKKINQ